ncbi:MAG: dockerin type I domain-containing protein [Planctomycetota bacterium]|nr:dockerin type I domain-containing protein [Planctomycetota bacterium]
MVIGAIAFGMMQRGCNADGSADQRANVRQGIMTEPPDVQDFTAPRGIRQTGPDGQVSRPTIRPASPSRSTSADSRITSSVGGPSQPAQPGRRRGGAAGDDSADSGRTVPAPISAPRRPVTTTTTGAPNQKPRFDRNRPSQIAAITRPGLPRPQTTEDARTPRRSQEEIDSIAEEAARAREAFNDQLADSSESESRSKRNARNGAEGASASESRSDGESGESDAVSDLLKDLGLSDAEVSAARNAMRGNGGAAGSATGGGGVGFSTVGGRPSTSVGGGGNGGNNGGGNGNGGNNGGGNPGGGGVVQPPPPPPPPPPPAIPTPSVSARWMPVERSAGPDGFATADLFLAFDSPVLLTLVISDPVTGLRVDGGRIFQSTSTFASNGPPSNAATSLFPELEADSFLTIGGQTPTFVPGGEPNRNEWGRVLSATWFTLPPLSPSANPARFGDNRLYVWIGRFSVGGDNPTFQGLLIANYIDLLTGQNTAMPVPITNCESCWEGADGQLPPAELLRIDPFSSVVASGTTTEVAVTLNNPAPPEGVEVALSVTPLGAATIPPTITIPAGETSATFELAAGRVPRNIEAQLVARADGRVVSAPLRVEVIRPTSLTFSPSTVRGGQYVTATVTLNGPAPEGGAPISIFTDASGRPFTEFPQLIRVTAGKTKQTFTIRTRAGVSRVTARFAASYLQQGVFGDLIIENFGGDLDGSGEINAADLGSLLGSWGACDPATGPCGADINQDGTVNAADLAQLLGSWGAIPDDGAGPGGEPGQPDDFVVARWVDVDTGACADIGGFRTADLYLGFLSQSRVTVVESSATTGISITNGAFYQDSLGSNVLLHGVPAAFPCLRADSALSIDGQIQPPVAFAGDAPNAANWGGRLVATWFVTTTPPGVPGLQNEPLFGDDRFYVRIGRFTAPASASVRGRVGTFFVNTESNRTEEAFVDVPDWGATLARLDVNQDGMVDAGDIAALTNFMGSAASGPGDLDGDGFITQTDLRMLIQEVADRVH